MSLSAALAGRANLVLKCWRCHITFAKYISVYNNCPDSTSDKLMNVYEYMHPVVAVSRPFLSQGR